MGDVNFTSLSSSLIFIMFYLCKRNNESLKPESKHYLISETYTVSRSQGAGAGPSLVCRNTSFFVK